MNLRDTPRVANRALDVLAIGLIGFSVVATILSWLVALSNASDADEWFTNSGGHGPWRTIYEARLLLDAAMTAPVVAVMVSLLSLVLARNGRTLAILTGGVAFWFMLTMTHGWLID